MQIVNTESGIRVDIHFIERTVHGNGIGIKVYGEILMREHSWVWAHELKLNTLEELQLTPMGIDQAYGHGKYIYNKGLYGNYASKRHVPVLLSLSDQLVSQISHH